MLWYCGALVGHTKHFSRQQEGRRLARSRRITVSRDDWKVPIQPPVKKLDDLAQVLINLSDFRYDEILSGKLIGLLYSSPLSSHFHHGFILISS